MTYAAVTYVDLQGQDPAEGLKVLNDMMVPRLKALPGFQGARFMRSQDSKSGVGSVLFDTEAHAMGCLDAMISERPAQAPPVTSTALYELILEV